jgi:hypothetical protein
MLRYIIIVLSALLGCAILVWLDSPLRYIGIIFLLAALLLSIIGELSLDNETIVTENRENSKLDATKATTNILVASWRFLQSIAIFLSQLFTANKEDDTEVLVDLPSLVRSITIHEFEKRISLWEKPHAAEPALCPVPMWPRAGYMPKSQLSVKAVRAAELQREKQSEEIDRLFLGSEPLIKVL